MSLSFPIAYSPTFKIAGGSNGASFLAVEILVGGDSIANRTVDEPANNAEFVSYALSNGIGANLYDGAQGGLTLASFFTGGAEGPYYPTRWDVIPEQDQLSAAILSFGTNDGGSYGSKSAWKQNLIDLCQYMVADPNFASLQNIFLRPLGRHIISTELDDEWQDMREAQYEVADELGFVHMLAPYYDLPIDIADNVHPNSDGMLEVSRRDAERMAFILGTGEKRTKGMEIVSAVVGATGVECTISHNDGDDLTVPVTGGVDVFGLFDGATRINLSKIEKVSANKIRLYTGAPLSSEPVLKSVYGNMNGLTPLTPEIIYDNSDRSLPITYGEIDVTNPLLDNDPILRLSDLNYYVDPSNGKTFTTGTNFNEIAGVDGTTFTAVGDDFDYDSAAFGGNGGMGVVAVTAGLRGDDDLMTMTSEFMFGFDMDIAADGDCVLFGSTAFGGYGSASMYVDGGDLKSFRYDGATNQPTIETGVTGTKISVIVDVQSTSVTKVYVNDIDNVTTLDMGDGYWFGWATMFIGGGRSFQSLSNKFGLSFGKTGAHDAVTDPTIAELMAQLNAHKNGETYNGSYIESGYFETGYIEGV